MAAGGIEVARAYVTIIPSLEGSQKTISQELGAVVDKEGDKAGKSLGQKLLSGTGSILKTGGKILGGLAVTAATAAVAGVTAITKQAVSSFAEYEQLAGGVEKIFSGMDTSGIMKDASEAYKTLNMSANEYLESINNVGAMFKSTMGDEKAYETAKIGMQAISDYASGTGKDINLLNEKFGMITRSTSSYQSIADQFAGVLPVTSAGFLEQAQAAGFLSSEYTKLTDVPVAEYQQAVSAMLEKGTAELGLAGNTAAEALGTISGSLAASKSAWSNFVTALAGGGDIATEFDHLKEAIFGVEGASNGLVNNVLPVIEMTITSLVDVLPNMISSMLPIVISTIQEIIPKIVEVTASIVPVLTNAIEQLFGSGFSDLVDSVASAVPQLAGALLDAIPVIIKALDTIVTTLINAAVKILPDLLNSIVKAIPGFLKSVIDIAFNVCRAVIEAIPNMLVAVIEALSGLVEELPALFEYYTTALQEFWPMVITNVVEQLPMIIEALIGLVRSIVAAIPQIIISLVEAIPTIIEQLLTAVITCLPQIIAAIVQLTFMIIRELPTILASLWDAVIACFDMLYNQLPQTIMNLLPIIITAVGDILTSIWNTLVEFFTDLGDWFFNTEVGQFLVNLATVFSMIYNEVKSFLHDLFEPFTSFMSKLFNNLKTWFTEVFNKIKEVFTNIFNTVKEKLTNIFNKVKEVFTNIYNAIKTPIDNAKNTVVNIINSMKSTITNAFNNIYSTVQNIFNQIKSAITGPIDTAKNAVSNAISSMRNIINNAGFSLPHIQLPHFSISGSFRLKPPSVPNISVSWYDKGYDEAQILRDATVFGIANGNLLAGGEHGNEVVVGEDHLIDLIRDNTSTGNITVNVYGAPGQDEDTLARIVIDKIQDITNSKEVVYA